MNRAATSADVARLAGVSRTAVSLVLNGRGEGQIAPETQAAIHAAAAELRYRPNRVALSLRHQQTHTIGVVTDAIATTAFGGRMLAGAMGVAHEAGYVLLVIDTMDDPELQAEALVTLHDRKVDGLMVAAMSQRLYEPGPDVPAGTVLVNCHDSAGRFTSVTADEEGGGRAAVRCLLDAGHRRIALLTGRMDAEAAALRLAGNRAALAEARLTAVAEGLGGWDISDGFAAGTELLGRPDRPTGIVCSNDRSALGVLLAAARLGLDVPGDVSLVGYDDDENVAPTCVPALTTVALPHREIGETATHLLLETLQKPRHRPPTQHLLPCPLVERATVAAPPR